MHLNPVVRDLALVATVVSVGWWFRDAAMPVQAQRSSSSSSSRGSGDASLMFQLSGVGAETALTVYNPANHTLYVYPRVGTGNSHINCEFSFTIANPGAPIERQNCPVGDQVPR
jgi:hypothetical protein